MTELDLGAELSERYRLLGVQAIIHADGVVLKRGMTRVFLQGPNVHALLERLVDDSRNNSGVSRDSLKMRLSEEEWPVVDAIIDALSARRLLRRIEAGEPEAPSRETPEGIFYWDFGASGAEVRQRLAERAVPIFGVNAISVALLANLRASGMTGAYLVDHPRLRGLGLAPPVPGTEPVTFEEWTESDAPDGAGCFVVCSDFGGLELMREWNAYCVEHQVNFFAIVLQDYVAYIGPMVLPNRSPCFECIWSRQNSNLDDPVLARATERMAFFGQHVVGGLPLMATAAASVAAMELLKYFSQSLPGGNIGKLIELDLMEPALRVRRALKVPFCRVCSGARHHPAPAADYHIFIPGNAQEG